MHLKTVIVQLFNIWHKITYLLVRILLILLILNRLLATINWYNFIKVIIYSEILNRRHLFFGQTITRNDNKYVNIRKVFWLFVQNILCFDYWKMLCRMSFWCHFCSENFWSLCWFRTKISSWKIFKIIQALLKTANYERVFPVLCDCSVWLSPSTTDIMKEKLSHYKSPKQRKKLNMFLTPGLKIISPSYFRIEMSISIQQ